VVKVPVVGEDVRKEVRTREMFAEKVFNRRRVGMESRQVSRGQGDAVLVQAGEIFVVGVVRDDYVVFVKVWIKRAVPMDDSVKGFRRFVAE
jgi:hypothetical protein